MNEEDGNRTTWLCSPYHLLLVTPVIAGDNVDELSLRHEAEGNEALGLEMVVDQAD